MSDSTFWDRIFKGTATPWAAVEELVRQNQREVLHLEFKITNAQDGKPTGDDQKNLGKSLSAFANTEGGVLLFGVKTKGDTAERINPILRLDAFTAAIEDLKRDRIDPPLAGVEVTPIRDPADPTRGLVAVRIPESVGGPHRARNAGDASERYYQRGGSSNEVIPHKMLAALFGLPPAPALRLRITQASSHVVEIVLVNAGRGVAREIRVGFSFKDERRNTAAADVKDLAGVSTWTRCSGYNNAILPGRQNHMILYPADETPLMRVTFPASPYAPSRIDFVGTISFRIDCLGAQPVIVTDAPLPAFVNDGAVTLPEDV